MHSIIIQLYQMYFTVTKDLYNKNAKENKRSLDLHRNGTGNIKCNIRRASLK